MEATCSLLPITSYKNDCDIIIERYLSKIIENSVNAVSPEQFCSTLKICPAKQVEVKNKMYEIKSKKILVLRIFVYANLKNITWHVFF